VPEREGRKRIVDIGWKPLPTGAAAANAKEAIIFDESKMWTFDI